MVSVGDSVARGLHRLPHTLRSAALSLVRRRGRAVVWTPEFMGFGNQLLVFEWIREQRESVEPMWSRRTPAMLPWLEAFPGLRDFVLSPRGVRFTDRRLMPWSDTARDREAAAAPYAAHDMVAAAGFIRDVLIPGSAAEQPDFAASDDGQLVINVRRGDYYSVPHNRGEYGFDLNAYLGLAVAGSIEQDGVPTSILVVSDGMDWCRARLGWLSEYAPVRYAESAGPVEDFFTLAAARRLVMTNSTFSYWAAHLGNVVRGDNYAQIWAPRFFDRSRNEGRSWMLNEKWSIIEDIPGGWDS